MATVADLAMVDCFYRASTSARLFSFAPLQERRTELVEALRQWETRLRRCTDLFLSEFKELHWTELSRIKGIVRITGDQQLMGLHDRIFVNNLQFGHGNPIRGMSVQFANFIKGIMFFARHDIVQNQPIYHRLVACGTGTDAFRNEFQRFRDGMTTESRRDVKRRIETCYIERLIYDDMFRRLSLAFPETAANSSGAHQDPGHIHRLSEVKKDYKSCYPNLDIEIKIEYSDAHLPISLEIKRSLRGHVCSIELYEKHLTVSLLSNTTVYEDFVDCTKTTFARDGTSARYTKLQRFARDERWVKLP